MRRSRDWGFFIFAPILVIISMLGTWGCRENAIEQCERRGGEALVPPPWSRDPTDVRCLKDGLRER